MRAAERTGSRELRVDMDRREVADESGEQIDVAFADRAARGHQSAASRSSVMPPPFARQAYLASSALRQRLAMHLVGAVADAQEARLREGLGEEEVLRKSGPAVDLDRAIEDLSDRRRNDDLGDRDLVARGLGAVTIHAPGGLQGDEPRLLELAARLADRLAHGAHLRERRTKGERATCARRHIASMARSARPMKRMQWWMRPGPSALCAISKPRPSPSSIFDAGVRTP